MIAHRLSTILQCDMICFLENGRIVEQGTHEQLMKLNGRYAEMISLQSMQLEKREVHDDDEEEIKYA